MFNREKVKSRKRSLSISKKSPAAADAAESVAVPVVGSKSVEDSSTVLPASWRSLYVLLELLCEVKTVQEPWLLVEPLCNCMQEALSLGLRLAGRILQQILVVLQRLVELAIAEPPKNTGNHNLFYNLLVIVLNQYKKNELK